ncbi:TIGR01777 family oxidoreductase [Christiangramia sp. SM2212]|uniref:TIGR01777 family oxidoreductase n=1 Tax=Christiangramia sediminicola TaxID=3073267 RepID=A0ABU1EMN2_9FLAO|nr:TIGR01777 family oxidoreductase [Christiangramia sp. SM2212]MDR5589646.1 TIGR01777 family oxidoreductase [Christiangramia sp. SM2212]
MRVLITGATGLIGSKLSSLCREEGIKVNYLTTSKSKIENKEDYQGFFWDPKNDVIEAGCIKDVHTIVHLAGAGIAEPWTESYKNTIIKSRTRTAALLHKTLKENSNQVENFISASAIGVYPSSLEKLYFEDESEVADNFVGEVVRKWEAAADEFESLGLDVAKIRVGLVLAENGGMLEKIKKPISLNMGAALGSGKQWQSWIHIEDLAGIFLYAIKNHLTGIYNAVAPNPVTNKVLTKDLAKQMGKSVWLPNVPSFALKALLGEMSQIVLSSQLVSNKKIESAGYNFKYTNLSRALGDLT